MSQTLFAIFSNFYSCSRCWKEELEKNLSVITLTMKKTLGKRKKTIGSYNKIIFLSLLDAFTGGGKSEAGEKIEFNFLFFHLFMTHAYAEIVFHISFHKCILCYFSKLSKVTKRQIEFGGLRFVLVSLMPAVSWIHCVYWMSDEKKKKNQKISNPRDIEKVQNWKNKKVLKLHFDDWDENENLKIWKKLSFELKTLWAILLLLSVCVTTNTKASNIFIFPFNYLFKHDSHLPRT